MNYLWGIMILVGVIYGACCGTLPDITDAALNSAKEAVTLCITMAGVMSFWMGLMQIAQNAGIIKSAAIRLKPVLKYLFPDIPEGHKANEYIAMNMIANIFGLGWAATPAGLKAMVELEKLRREKVSRANTVVAKEHYDGLASREMCTFLIINISSLQLIPINIIAYRSQYGSADPAAIVGPGIVATLCSTLAAVVFCKVMDGITKKEGSI